MSNFGGEKGAGGETASGRAGETERPAFPLPVIREGHS